MANSESNGTGLRSLREMVPLQMPLSLSIGLSNACNLKCSYCYHGSDQKARDVDSGKYKAKFLSKDDIKLICEQARAFPSMFKQTTLVGLGEPLISPNILYAVEELKKVSERIKIVTNATLLTPKLALELVNGGVDVIKISLQGLGDRKYREICGTQVDFSRICENISFLYNHRGKCKIHIKVADVALEPGEDKVFSQMFGLVSDLAWVEKISEVDEKGQYISDENRWGNVHNVGVCYFPFYYMYINHNLELFPCCEPNFVIGNIREKSLREYWDDDIKKLCISQLKEDAQTYPHCAGCHVKQTMYREENNLDENREIILKRYAMRK